MCVGLVTSGKRQDIKIGFCVSQCETLSQWIALLQVEPVYVYCARLKVVPSARHSSVAAQ